MVNVKDRQWDTLILFRASSDQKAQLAAIRAVTGENESEQMRRLVDEEIERARRQ